MSDDRAVPLAGSVQGDQAPAVPNGWDAVPAFAEPGLLAFYESPFWPFPKLGFSFPDIGQPVRGCPVRARDEMHGGGDIPPGGGMCASTCSVCGSEHPDHAAAVAAVVASFAGPNGERFAR